MCRSFGSTSNITGRVAIFSHLLVYTARRAQPVIRNIRLLSTSLASMATSRLLDSLHDFRSRFATFEQTRVKLRQIYSETRDAWHRWCKISPSGNVLNSSAFDASAREDGPSDDSPEVPVTFETRMANVTRLLEEKPTLMFVGQLKSGKSTLANAILRHHILPSDAGPCTARMVKLKFSGESKQEKGGIGEAYLQLLKADGTVIGERVQLEIVIDSKGISRLQIPQDLVSLGRETGFGSRRLPFRMESGEATEHAAWVEIYCSQISCSLFNL